VIRHDLGLEAPSEAVGSASAVRAVTSEETPAEGNEFSLEY
jgi:hypothetical protein